MPKGMRVRVPPRARFQRWIGFSEGDANLIAEGLGISGQRHSKFHERVNDNAFHLSVIRLSGLFLFR